MTDDEKIVGFDAAFHGCIIALETSGLAFERSPTLYANLLSMTIAKLFPSEPLAMQALDRLIADLRQMVPLHIAHVAAVDASPPDGARH